MLAIVVGVLSVLVATATEAQLGRIDLANPTPGTAQLFGAAHAGVGDTVAVGVPGATSGAEPGRVDVLDPLTGALLRAIANPTPAPGDRFGGAVAAAGVDVVVGAAGDDTVASDAGAAYLFDGATGALKHTFTVAGAGPGWNCGRRVGSVGGNVVVACPGHAAYLFDATTGALLQTFVGPMGTGFPREVGAVGGDLLATAVGVVHRFDTATGALLQSYPAPPPDAHAYGDALAVLPDRILLGTDYGAVEGVHVFDAASGALVHTIAQPPVPSAASFFGGSVAVSGDAIMVGSLETIFVFDAATYALRDVVLASQWRDSIGLVVSAHASGFTIQRHVGKGVQAAGGIVLLDLCGNGRRSDGEACDDGNTQDGDGCSSTCRIEACGALPVAGCKPPATPRGATLEMFEEYSLFGEKDRLRWKWRGGATDVADFGDPRSTATQVLCVWDRVPAIPRLLMNVAIPAGGTCNGDPCWTASGARGFRLDDPQRTPAGIGKMNLRAAQGRGILSIDGAGAAVGVPEPICPDCGLPVVGTVLVQLHNTQTGACWESAFPTGRNAKRKYKARSD